MIVHFLRNVLPDERGFTGAKLWQKYYLYIKGGSVLTSVLQEQRLMSNTQSFPSYNAMPQPMMQMMRRRTPFTKTTARD